MDANASQPLRYRLNNLPIGNITAATSLNVDTTIASLPADYVGTVGFAVPRDADWATGLPMPQARITSQTNLRLRFPNPTAADVNPADTFDWDVILFPATGNIQQTI